MSLLQVTVSKCCARSRTFSNNPIIPHPGQGGPHRSSPQSRWQSCLRGPQHRSFWSHRSSWPSDWAAERGASAGLDTASPKLPLGTPGSPAPVLFQGLHLQTSGSWEPALPAEMRETPTREHLVWPFPSPPCFSPGLHHIRETVPEGPWMPLSAPPTANRGNGGSTRGPDCPKATRPGTLVCSFSPLPSAPALAQPQWGSAWS